jgi:hypothetical protein
MTGVGYEAKSTAIFLRDDEGPHRLAEILH